VVVVNGGEIIPVDGIITEGLANIDEHHLTGESRPNDKAQGDQVFASTIVLSGKIYVAVERTGNETTVAKIGKILNNTVEFKASTQLRAEHLADKTVIPTLIVSGLAFPFFGFLGSLAIVNAHFKDKMTIVAPISIMNFLNIASQKGILIKDGRTLDLLNLVDTIVFDKTGTLTEEQPQVGEIYPSIGYEKDDVLRWAAAAEQKQQHPIAKAILKAAQTLEIPNIDETEYKMGYGLTVKVNQKWIRAGSLRFMELAETPVPPHIRKIQTHCHEIGHSLILVAVDNIVIGAIELLPVMRSEVKKVISQLRQWPSIKTIYIISGDHETPTQKLAQSLNIDHYFAETLPEQKAEIITQLQNEGKFICYIGDGINDSIALKKAQVSISLRGASTIATDTAQIILMDGSLTQLISVFELAQDFHKNIDFAFATVLLPTIIGAGGVFFLHFGLIETIFFNWAGLVAGMSNATLPLLKHKIKNKTNPNKSPPKNKANTGIPTSSRPTKPSKIPKPQRP
jgi:Cu2+-exporting ATPase